MATLCWTRVICIVITITAFGCVFVAVAVKFVTGWVDDIVKGAGIEFWSRTAAAGVAICDSGMLPVLSVEESELAMAAAYGGR
jgi:hypothetical protein